MGGFLGGMLGPGINALSTVVGGAQAANAKASEAERAAAIQQIAAQRQAKEDQLKEILMSAQSRHLDTQSNQITNPTPKKVYDPTRGALVDEGTGTASAVTGLPDKPATDRPPQYDSQRGGFVSQEGTFTPVKGLPAIPEKDAKDHFTFITTTGPDGKQIVSRANTATGQIEATDTQAKNPAAGGGISGSAQNMQARLIAAVSEGRLADERMDKFVREHTKGGQLDVGSLEQIGGNLATNLASSHKPSDIMLQGMAEGNMNENNPAYMQFLRDARLISRAEQLMSARGGSEAMANDNAFLARGGAHAPVASLEAASRTRKAMFGKMGAIMQTMSPEQQAKLAAGLDALTKDDEHFDYEGTGKALVGGAAPSSTGSVDFRAASAQATAPAVLSQADKIRAAKDPRFAAWLKARGALP